MTFIPIRYTSINTVIKKEGGEVPIPGFAVSVINEETKLDRIQKRPNIRDTV